MFKSIEQSKHTRVTHFNALLVFWSYLTDIIEGVQRTATIIVKDKPYRERLKELNSLSLTTRRVYFDLIVLFKMKLGLLDYYDYLKEAGTSLYTFKTNQPVFQD